LTIGGKAPVIAASPHRQADFRKLLTVAVAIARRRYELHDLAARQKAWLKDNPEHELFFERKDANDDTWRRAGHLTTDLHIATGHAQDAFLAFTPADREALNIDPAATAAWIPGWIDVMRRETEMAMDDLLSGKEAPF
jgi:hypothetical protein